jgi:amidase
MNKRPARQALLILCVAVNAGTSVRAAADVPFPIEEATVRSIHTAMLGGHLTCRQLVSGYLARIAAYDHNGPGFNSIQTVNPLAMQEAAGLDARFQETGRLSGPLHCIPVMLKDQVEKTGMPTTYGSLIFKTYMPARNATVVLKLEAAGAIILAKTNLGEFAAGGSGSAFGDCHNAYNPLYYASGSSCGTGVAIAANLGAVGIGEDTVGSLRGPAAHGSLVGIRPTMGLVSRFAVLPQAPTRDTLGPITRTVADAAILLDALAGYDPADPVTAESVGKIPPTYTAFLDPNGLRGMRFGVIRTPLYSKANTSTPDYREVQDSVTRVIAEMRARGAAVIDPIEIPHIVDMIDASNSEYETEDATNEYLAQLTNPPVHTFKEIAESPLVIASRHKQLAAGVGRSSNDPALAAALKARIALRITVLKVMADHQLDGLIYPPFDHTPPKLPGSTAGSNRVMATFLGWPAIELPAGFDAEGLPLGIEMLGRPWSEGLLIKAGYDFEQATMHRHSPNTAPPLPR